MRSRRRERRRCAHGALGGRCLVCGGPDAHRDPRGRAQRVLHGLRERARGAAADAAAAGHDRARRVAPHGMARALGVIGVPVERRRVCARSGAGARARCGTPACSTALDGGGHHRRRSRRCARVALAARPRAALRAESRGGRGVCERRPPSACARRSPRASSRSCSAATAPSDSARSPGSVPESGRVGLVYLDVHGDLNTPRQRPRRRARLDGRRAHARRAEHGARAARVRSARAAARRRSDRAARARHAAQHAPRDGGDRAPRPDARVQGRRRRRSGSRRAAPRWPRSARATGWPSTSTSTASTSPMRRSRRTPGATPASARTTRSPRWPRCCAIRASARSRSPS